MPRPGDEFGRYHIDSQIGVGGMGVVFRATDRQLNRAIALKVVSAQFAQSEEFQRRFAREAEVMARVESPYIVQIFDYGTYDGCPYLASQYVGGGDLADLLQAGGALPADQAATVCAQVAGALAAAHRAGVVHRDVKPSNVLLWERSGPDDDVHAFLCDFGIAQPSNTQALTQTGGITGSLGYLAPERVRGARATPASDIYALGCVLWACLTGGQPYAGDDVQVAMAHVNADVPQLRGGDPVVESLNEILRRAMAKDPAHRFDSAEELRSALTAVARTATGVPRADAVVPTRPRQPEARWQAAASRRFRSRRTPVVAGIAALCLALVAGLVIFLVTRGDRTKDDSAHGRAGKSKSVPGDANGDGKGDITFVVSGQTAAQRITALSRADGYGSPIVHKWAGPNAAPNLMSADVNGDGKADLITVDVVKGAVRWVDHTTGADHTVIVDTSAIASDSDIGSISAGDFDGDGHVDLAFPSYSKSIFVSLGSGHGTWAKPTRWFVAPSSLKDASLINAAGDVNGDGKTDFAAFTDRQLPRLRSKHPAAVPDGIALLASNGKAFTLARPQQSFVVPVDRALIGSHGLDTSSLVGDLDGDGKAEQVYIKQYLQGRAIRVSKWDGAGFSAPSQPWYDEKSARLTSFFGDEFGLADINGDGKDDLLSLHRVAKGTYTVYWQQSTGTKLLPSKQLLTRAVPLPRASGGSLAQVF